ncbi:MAG: hypothetical protein M0P58_08905 [Bacteroidales bacterium]|jgi:hypothetical protein|nr:hypothetical protein [Bacteroidales bacterium]
MVYTKYDLHFRIKNKGTTLGSLDFITVNLKEVFDQLYQEVVTGSCINPLTDGMDDDPAMISAMNITITKKQVKS